MKKVKFEGKLSLNKKTIANLNKNQMNEVKGGRAIWSLTTICYSANPRGNTGCASCHNCTSSTC